VERELRARFFGVAQAFHPGKRNPENVIDRRFRRGILWERALGEPARGSAARDLRQVCNEVRQSGENPKPVAKENGMHQPCRTVAAPAL